MERLFMIDKRPGRVINGYVYYQDSIRNEEEEWKSQFQNFKYRFFYSCTFGLAVLKDLRLSTHIDSIRELFTRLIICSHDDTTMQFMQTSEFVMYYSSRILNGEIDFNNFIDEARRERKSS